MDVRGTRIGEVAGLWRYPVRSLQGEKLDVLNIGLGGVIGDRRYAVADPEIEEIVSSAQGKRRWRGLVTMRARYDGAPGEETTPPAVIETEEGATLRSDAPDVDRRLSDLVGRPARLVREGSMKAPYSYAPLHLLTTASLNAFTAHYPTSRFAPKRFRPNILLDTGEQQGFIENGWIGRVLAIGESLRLVIKEHCKRCVMTTLAQGDLPQDPAVLQVVNETNNAHAGVYAEVTKPGVVKQGDAIVLVD